MQACGKFLAIAAILVAVSFGPVRAADLPDGWVKISDDDPDYIGLIYNPTTIHRDSATQYVIVEIFSDTTFLDFFGSEVWDRLLVAYDCKGEGFRVAQWIGDDLQSALKQSADYSILPNWEKASGYSLYDKGKISDAVCAMKNLPVRSIATHYPPQ